MLNRETQTQITAFIAALTRYIDSWQPIPFIVSIFPRRRAHPWWKERLHIDLEALARNAIREAPPALADAMGGDYHVTRLCTLTGEPYANAGDQYGDPVQLGYRLTATSTEDSSGPPLVLYIPAAINDRAAACRTLIGNLNDKRDEAQPPRVGEPVDRVLRRTYPNATVKPLTLNRLDGRTTEQLADITGLSHWVAVTESTATIDLHGASNKSDGFKAELTVVYPDPNHPETPASAMIYPFRWTKTGQAITCPHLDM